MRPKQKGKKEIYRQQLRKAIEDKLAIQTVDDANKKGLMAFPSTAKWRTLQPIEEPVKEPVNQFARRAPTVPVTDEFSIPTKHEFRETFEREEFTGKMLALNNKGKPILNNGEYWILFLFFSVFKSLTAFVSLFFF